MPIETLSVACNCASSSTNVADISEVSAIERSLCFNDTAVCCF